MIPYQYHGGKKKPSGSFCRKRKSDMYRKDEKQAKAFSKFFSGTKEQDRSASDEIPVDSKIKIHTPHDNEHQLQVILLSSQ